MRRIGPILMGAITLVTLCSVSAVATAQQLQCNVHSIRAAITGSEISSPLAPYRDQLMRPPLSTFTSFELIDTQRLTLRLGSASDLNLGLDITGQLEFDSVAGTQQVFNLSLRHGRRNLLNSRIAMTPGRPFFIVVGSVIPDGTLVLGIVCR